MKSKKYKLKSKPKYANGVQDINTYKEDPLQANKLQAKSISEGQTDSTISTGLNSTPYTAAFMALGKLGYNTARSEDEFGVAKSNFGAGIGSTFAPHKGVLRGFEEGGAWEGIEAAFNPFGASARQNKRDKVTRDRLIKEHQAMNNMKQFQGVDDTLSQTSQIYKQGTKGAKGRKEVEAEGGELVFSKVGSKYKLKADLKGPSHANGGVDLTVSEGDVIVPKKDAASVRKLVGKNKYVSNDAKFNSYRMKLPKDKPVAADGSDYLKPKGLGGVTPQFNIDPQVTGTTAPAQDLVETGGGGFMANAGGYLNTAAQLAPSLYNLGQGVFGKVEKEKANFLTPDLLKYQDSSDPTRRASESAYRIDAANARNLSGGNAGNIRANLNIANVANFNRKQDINQAEVDRALNIQNANVGIKNNANAYNTQEKTRVQNTNSMNKANKSVALAKGLEGIQQYANVAKQDKAQTDQNEVLYDTLETRNYKFDKKKRKYVAKK